jgi:hypothetical protein
MVFDFTQFWLDGRPGNESFDTTDTPGCASAVFADNQSENEI